MLAGSDATGASQAGPLLDQVDGSVMCFTADGAYDWDSVYDDVAARHREAVVVVPPRANAVPSSTAGTAPTQRDRHLQSIEERDRMVWQAAPGLQLARTGRGRHQRFKCVIGDALRSRTDRRRATKVAIAVGALNRMLDLESPEYVRAA